MTADDIRPVALDLSQQAAGLAKLCQTDCDAAGDFVFTLSKQDRGELLMCAAALLGVVVTRWTPPDFVEGDDADVWQALFRNFERYRGTL